MGRRPAVFTEADLNRALRVVEKLGWEDRAVVEISRLGTIRIVPMGIAGKTQEREIDEPEPVDL